MIHASGLALQHQGGPRLSFPDLAVPQGHTLLLRGDSGSGKSTLLAMLAGLLAPSQGHLQVAGTDPWSLTPARRDAWRGRTLGLLPQRAWVNPALSVWQHLALPAVCTGETPDAEAIDHLLQRLGLAAWAHQPARALSGGQVQRLALGRALVRHPQVVLADEPTASLDDRHTAQVLEQLRELGGRATVVIATHDARVIQALQGRPDTRVCTLPPTGDPA